jgi:hypothetical protein
MDMDAVIAKVAKEHRVLLGKDDPILVAVALNKEILEAYVAEIDEKLRRNAEMAAEENVRALDVSKKTAENLINGAAAFVAGEIKSAGEALKREMLGEIRREIERAENLRHDETSASRMPLYLSLINAAITAGLLACAFYMDASF